MQRTMASYDELHRDVATSNLLAVRPGICTCELDLHDCTSPSRTSETDEPSAIIPDSVQISRKPASWNRLPIMDRRSQVDLKSS